LPLFLRRLSVEICGRYLRRSTTPHVLRSFLFLSPLPPLAPPLAEAPAHRTAEPYGGFLPSGFFSRARCIITFPFRDFTLTIPQVRRLFFSLLPRGPAPTCRSVSSFFLPQWNTPVSYQTSLRRAFPLRREEGRKSFNELPFSFLLSFPEIAEPDVGPFPARSPFMLLSSFPFLPRPSAIR